MKRYKRNIIARIHAIYREKWLIAMVLVCAERPSSVLLANAQVLTREMIDDILLQPTK